MTDRTHIADDSWERLSALLEGDLSESETRGVERDLGQDPSLRALYQDLQRATQLMRTAGPVAAPDRFLDGVMAAVAQEPIPANRPLRGWRMPFRVPFEGLLVVAAAAVVLFLAIPREDEEAEDAAGAARVDLQKVVDAVPPAVPAPTAKTVAGDATSASSVGVRRGGDKVVAVEREAAPAAPEVGGTSDDEPPAVDSEKPAPVGFGAPLRYSVNTGDEAAVTRLVQLAGRFGGKLSDDAGKTLTTTDLKAGPAVVFLRIPADRLSEFDAALRSLGRDVSADRDDEKLQVGDTVEGQVTVQLAP
jgi:anti-sigma factor RsiW